MTQGKHFAAGGDHFAALPSKKIHTPKGIARLTVTAATMAAMTGSSLISPFTAFAQTGDGGTQHPAVMSPIAAHAGAASGTGAKSAAQTIADLQKAVNEAKAKEDAAKAAYDEAAGPYNEAASARDQAKASYDSAVNAGTAADRAAMDEYARQVAEGKDAADAAGKDLEQAKAGLADAKADASEKDEAYQSALKAAQDAKDALDKAKADAVSATPEAISAAKQANADAVAKLDAAKQAVKDAESAKAAADEELANAKTAKDTADAAVTAAQQKVGEAQTKVDLADAQLKQGAIGFFKAMGADSAIEIIQNCTYKDYTEIGNSLDATGLENMLSSITVMKNVNAYRKSVGLSELEVSYKLIAAAIADANYSTKNVEHAQQFDVGENLAWSYRDPCKVWIYQEKDLFDKTAASLGATNLSGKDAYDFWYANQDKFDYYRIGHYMNIINPDYAVMGCGLNDDTRLTFSLTLQYGGWAGSGWNTGAISVDEYEQKLTSYINGLKNAKSALDAVKADLASKQQAAAGAAATVQQKQVAVDSAQADVDAAKQGVADAQRAVDAAKADLASKQQGVTDAQTELDAAKSDLDAANAAVDTAKSTVQQKQVAFDAANAAVTTVQSKLDAAKADTSAKQQSVADANADLAKFFQDVADAKKAVDTAKSVHDAAAAGQAEKAAVLAAAKQKADATARALADAQRAVDAAKTDTGVAADRLTGSQTDLDDAQSNLDILTDLAAKLAEAQQREQDAVKAVNDTKAALDAAKADAIAAESLVSAAEQAKAQADAKLSKLNSIDAGAAIASGHDVNADDALNALFAAAVEARAKVAPAKAILDERQAAVDGLQPGYDAALAAYELAKSDRIAAEQKLSDEIARQEAEEAAKQQAAYTPKHLAGTDTAQPGSLAQTGDRAGLIGETFVIGGTVLVATGVFLDQKKRREQM